MGTNAVQSGKVAVLASTGVAAGVTQGLLASSIMLVVGGLALVFFSRRRRAADAAAAGTDNKD